MLPTLDAARSKTLPQVSDYLVYPWLLPGRLTLMVGPSNVGKTTLTLEIIANALKGTHLWHRYPCRKISRILYLHAEHTVETLQEMVAVRGDIPENTVQVIHDFGTLTPRLIEDGKPRFALVNEILSNVADWQPQLIIFEPISAFVGVSENDNAAVRTLVNTMAAIGAACKAAVLTHHHLGKPRLDAQGHPLEPKDQGEARGAAAFEDAAECVVYLRKADAGESQRIRIETSKIKGFPITPILVSFDPDTLSYSHVPQPFMERDLIALYNWKRLNPGASVRDTIEYFRGVWKGTRDAKIILLLRRAARVGLVPMDVCDGSPNA